MRMARAFYHCTECGQVVEAHNTIEHPIEDEDIEITLCLDCADGFSVLGEWYERTVGYNPEEEGLTGEGLRELVAEYRQAQIDGGGE
jgi:hypothetical protein